jgi:hypothetical protein
MKVLGISSEGYSSRYIVEITHDELKAAFDKGYNEKLVEITGRSSETLRVGDELDLRTIPNQRVRIAAATEAMTKAYVEFVKAAPVMADIARVIAHEQQHGLVPTTPTESAA